MPRLFTTESLDDEPTKVRPPPPMPAPRILTAPLLPTVAALPRSDLEALDANRCESSKPERLTTVESRAFSGMRNKMSARPLYALSYAQRSWAKEVAARLDLEVSRPPVRDARRDP